MTPDPDADSADGLHPQPPAAPEPLGEQAGTTIDRYTLVEPIGEGGMGTVWRASQSVPIRREVALKVIKLGMDTREIVGRFEAERQALALMDHPGIAKVIDGGATGNGRPYFVMELVEGAPITVFCREHGLGLRERLALFVKVCAAVQHAHHKGVIHRDLKPSNVLVAAGDDGPAPKVIDFGIAKATGAEFADQTIYTQAGQMIGTPEYMAPEQVDAGGADIDTRADVYSLGVLLYELLTGMKPFDMRAALSVGLDELLRQIREIPPSKPSTRVSSFGPDTDTSTAPGNVDTVTLSRRLRGDLDWVVMKAIEKDRTRRYDTPAALAEDVERYLRREPVTAAPPSAAYRIRMFVRRRRRTVAALVTIAVLLIGGLVGTGYGLVQARNANEGLRVAVDEKQDALDRETEQRELAQENEARATAAEADARRELARAQEVKRLVLSMLQGAQPEIALGRDATILREIADDTAARVLAGEVEDPLVAAEVNEMLGMTFLSLDDLETARRHFERARDGYTDELGAEDPRTIAVRRNLLATDILEGDVNEKVERGYELLELALRVRGADSIEEVTLRTIISESCSRLGRFDEAEELLQLALEIADRVASGASTAPAGDWAEEAAAQSRNIRRSLADLCVQQSRFDEAMERFDEVLEESLAEEPEDAPVVLGLRRDHLAALIKSERAEDAEAVARDLLEDFERILGRDNVRTVDLRFDLAGVLSRRGRYDEALALAAESVAWYEKAFGSDDRLTSFARYRRLYIVFQSGDLEGTASELDDLLEAVRVNGAGDELGEELKLMNFASIVRQQTGQLHEAQEILEETIEQMIEYWGLDARDTLGAITNLGWIYLRTGRPEEALAQFEKSLPRKREVLGETHQFTRAAMAGLEAALRATGDQTGALQIARELRAVELLRAEESPNDRGVLVELSQSMLVSPHWELRDPAEAVLYAERAVEVSGREDNNALGILATAYFMANRVQEAFDTATELLERLEPGTPLYMQVSNARARYEEMLGEGWGEEGDTGRDD